MACPLLCMLLANEYSHCLAISTLHCTMTIVILRHQQVKHHVIKVYGGGRYSSTHTSSQYWKEKSGQLYTLAALWLAKGTCCPLNGKLGGPQVWSKTLWRREKTSCSWKPAHSQVTILPMLWKSQISTRHISNCGHSVKISKTAVTLLGLLQTADLRSHCLAHADTNWHTKPDCPEYISEHSLVNIMLNFLLADPQLCSHQAVSGETPLLASKVHVLLPPAGPLVCLVPCQYCQQAAQQMYALQHHPWKPAKITQKCQFWLIPGLFNDTFSAVDVMWHQIIEWSVNNEVKNTNACDLFNSTLPSFFWSEWRNPEETSQERQTIGRNLNQGCST